ncbi:hypothetical protein, partial [Caballeronia sp.]|uniref:hypothetical protein n=1 Tax=Caballeronia sp. TaxID=1931223 RepID=UPI003C69A3F6
MASSLLTPPDQINCGVKPALARVIEHLYDHARFYRALQAPLENKWIDLLGKHSCSRRNQPRQEVARVANFPKELPNDERAFTCGQLLDNLLVSQMIGQRRFEMSGSGRPEQAARVGAGVSTFDADWGSNCAPMRNDWDAC